ncbi:hypothetical protein [Alicyclobacillus sacchari]|nr:hypothetical protein [Alicyclobacillus sacchari]
MSQVFAFVRLHGRWLGGERPLPDYGVVGFSCTEGRGRLTK